MAKKANKKEKKTTKKVEEVKEVEKVEKTEEPTPKKKKKKHKGLKIFLIIFTVLIVLPVGFVFGAFFDPSTKSVKNTEVYYENLVSNVINKGLEKVEQGEFVLTIDEKMIDGVMLAGCDKINLKNFIPKMYCKIKGYNYDFYMDLQFSFFKTRAIIKTYLNEVGKKDPTLTFKIKGVTLGRLPLPMNLVTGIAGKFISDDMINSAFAQSGFHIKCEFKKLQLTYSRSQFKEDVAAYIKKLANENEMLTATLNAFGEIADQLISTTYEDGVSAIFDLKKIALPKNSLNDSVYYHEAPINFQNLDDHQAAISEWLNKNYVIDESDGKINYFTEDYADEMFTYLLRGYKNLEKISGSLIDRINEYEKDSTFKNAISEYLSTTYAEEDVKLDNFKGSFVDDNNNERFEDYSLSEIDNKKYSIFECKQPYTSVSFNISSELINRVLANHLNELIGMTIPITFKENDKWQFNYITIDNIYVGFQSDKESNEPVMNFYIDINISGFPITIIVDTTNIEFGIKETFGENSLGYIQFNLKKDEDGNYKGVHFGQLDITDKITVDNLLNSIPKTDDSVFIYNSVTEDFRIYLDHALGGFDSPVRKELASLLKEHADEISRNIYVDENKALRFDYPKKP